MDPNRKTLVKRVAATAVIGGSLSLMGMAAASPASAATIASSSHSSVLTNITPAQPGVYVPPNCGCYGGNCSC